MSISLVRFILLLGVFNVSPFFILLVVLHCFLCILKNSHLSQVFWPDFDRKRSLPISPTWNPRSLSNNKYPPFFLVFNCFHHSMPVQLVLLVRQRAAHWKSRILEALSTPLPPFWEEAQFLCFFKKIYIYILLNYTVNSWCTTTKSFRTS